MKANMTSINKITQAVTLALITVSVSACMSNGSTTSADNANLTSPLSNCSFDASATDVVYDTVINNGRVMDPECNFDGIRNVGIKDGRIAVISADALKGNDTLDATDYVVAPGFINQHNHGFGPFDQKMMAHDGLTTILDTEAGSGSITAFYDKYEGNSFINYGTSISQEEVRRIHLDKVAVEKTIDPTFLLGSRGAAQEDGHASWALDIATPEQHETMMAMMDQGLREGAIAIGSTVGYMGYAVPTYEMFDMQKLTKSYDRFFAAHTRFGPTESLPLNYTLGVREVLANAAALDGALILSHIQNQNWEESYELAARMQAQGKLIYAEYYNAFTGTPNIATPQLLPDKIESNNIDPTKHIYNPETGELFESKEVFFAMQKAEPEKLIFIIVRDPSWMKQWPHMKNVGMGSDNVSYLTADGQPLPIEADFKEYGGHPRNSGLNGLTLREAREQNIPLMDLVNNLAYIPAKYFSQVGLKSMQERGRVQPGMVADLTLFNPDTVTDTSSMAEGMRGSYSKGIDHVMVSGKFIIRDHVADISLRQGKPIRYEPLESRDFDMSILNDKTFQWHADLPGVKNSHHSKDKNSAKIDNAIRHDLEGGLHQH